MESVSPYSASTSSIAVMIQQGHSSIDDVRSRLPDSHGRREQRNRLHSSVGMLIAPVMQTLKIMEPSVLPHAV